jgi:hypothetical protein
VLSVILTINNPLDTSRPLSSSEIVLYFRVLPLATTVLVGLWCVLDVIPRQEVTWALEAISGMAYGDDPDRWAAWWNELPTEIRERRRQHENDTAITSP